MTSPHEIDASFTALPYRRMADAALARAQDFHVSHADFRFERVRSQDVRVRDGRLQGASDYEDIGFAVRVVLNGAWGFASGVVLGQQSAVQVTENAIRTAQVAAAMTLRPIELAPEPTYADVEWVSAYETDPLSVPLAEKVELLSEWSRGLLDAPGRAPLDGDAAAGGGEQVLHRPRRHHDDPAAGPAAAGQSRRSAPTRRPAAFDSMRTIAPPVGRGWEYLVGDGYDWAAELDELPGLLAEKLAAPSVEAGRYDLVDPPVQPVADHPRVDRARDRARPGTRLRGQLRGHLLRHARPARHAAVRLPGHARHR